MNITAEQELQNKKSKGKLFKEAKGYSKTFSRNMKKLGLNPDLKTDVLKYKTLRKAVKVKQQVLRAAKLSKNRAERIGKAKPKKSKKGKSNKVEVPIE